MRAKLLAFVTILTFTLFIFQTSAEEATVVNKVQTKTMTQQTVAVAPKPVKKPVMVKIHSAAEVVKLVGNAKAIGKDKVTRTLKLHSPIYPHDEIFTEDKTFLGLRFTDGTLTVLGPKSHLILNEYVFNKPVKPAKVSTKVDVMKVSKAGEVKEKIVKKEIVSETKKAPEAIEATKKVEIKKAEVLPNEFKMKLETGEMQINAGKIAREKPKAFNIVTPAATVDLVNPNAKIYYTPTTGFVFGGVGYVYGSRGVPLQVTEESYVVIDSTHSLPVAVDKMPSVLSSSDSLELNSLLKDEISTYGEDVTYEGLTESVAADSVLAHDLLTSDELSNLDDTDDEAIDSDADHSDLTIDSEDEESAAADEAADDSADHDSDGGDDSVDDSDSDD